MNRIKKIKPVADTDVERKSESSEKSSEDLTISHQEINLQYIENEKQAKELILAYKKIELQDHEKEKRADELFTADNELIYQKREKEKRALELIIANKELAFQNVEKEKRAAELIIANDELKKTEAQLKEHIRCLEEMMFVISHKVRQPVVNILGLSNLIDLTTNGKEELNQIMLYIKQSALSLDTFTKELTTMIDDLAKKDCDDIINE